MSAGKAPAHLTERHPCPKGDACALGDGAVHCKHCHRNWPPDGSWPISEPLDRIDWYRRCLEDITDGRVVRGLAEAKAGYDSALADLRAVASSETGTAPGSADQNQVGAPDGEEES